MARVILAVAVVGALLASAGWLMRAEQRLDLEVLRAEAEDLDRLTSLDVRLTNRQHAPVANPVFSVMWEAYPYQWRAEGPDLIQPGDSAMYRLRPPAWEASPRGTRLNDGSLSFPAVLVRVTAGGSTYAAAYYETRVQSAQPLVNGRLVPWTALSRGDPPYGWRPVLKRSAQGVPALERAPGDAVTVSVQRATPEAEWAEAGLLQTTDLRNCETVRLVSSRTFDYEAIDQIWPESVAGIEVRDEAPDAPFHWFALTTRATRAYTLPSGDLISTVFAPRDRSIVELPLGRVLRGAGRELPRRGLLKVFVASYAEPGDYRLSVERLHCLDAPAYAATLRVQPLPNASIPDAGSYQVTAVNDGSATWEQAGPRALYLVGTLTPRPDCPGARATPFTRHALPRDVRPGESVRFPVVVPRSPSPGPYQLAYHLLGDDGLVTQGELVQDFIGDGETPACDASVR